MFALQRVHDKRIARKRCLELSKQKFKLEVAYRSIPVKAF